ncbi:selenocysteine insertion sequence-binding protein 2 [Biomphalaria pfeifferi]|uniref:Selenocysteine insertion sequence-binding protein 2 n=1 Tax=Biomphalaria pfeifferi TaxID=112525 RepID=A0AAD8BJI5_BIOPF|nr:selenocysteine insertion sequence-binding protein 2 [Biomphalaria pfeifferi]
MDKKGSSLSADAAEFVPLRVSETSKPGQSKHPGAQEKWKRRNAVEINEVPRYLTSCYPFVPPNSSKYRSETPRFQPPFHFQGNMSAATPMRFPPWPQVHADYMGSYLPTSYGGMAPLSLDMSKVEVPSQMNMALGHLGGQGLLLGAPPDPNSNWLVNSLSNMYMSQQHPQQYVNQPPVFISSATTVTSPSTVPISSQSISSAPVAQASFRAGNKASKSNTNTSVNNLSSTIPSSAKSKQSSVHQKVGVRPASPIMISRSAQTDFPASIKNLTVKEKPCLSFNRNRARSLHSVPRHKSSDHDSDSGYNSPLHQQNHVSVATQVEPSSLTNNTCDSVDTEPATSSLAGSSSISQAKPGDDLRPDGVRKKKKRQNREQRDANRMLGSNTKLLSRSSSSISSSGTKPDDDDDEKIDLHSWTDFPPVSPRLSAPVRTSNQPVTLTIERSAHEPPWSIKFSSADKTRSSSGDKQASSSQEHKGRNRQSHEKPGLATDTAKTGNLEQGVTGLNQSTERNKNSKVGDVKNKFKGQVKDPACEPMPVTRAVTTTTFSSTVTTTTVSMVTTTASTTFSVASSNSYASQLTGGDPNQSVPIGANDYRNKALAPQQSVLPVYPSDPSYRSYANIAQGIRLSSPNASQPPSHPPVTFQNGLFPPPLFPVVPVQPFPFFPGAALSQPPPAIIPYEGHHAPHFAVEPVTSMNYASQLRAPVLSYDTAPKVNTFSAGRGRLRSNSGPGGDKPGACLNQSSSQTIYGPSNSDQLAEGQTELKEAEEKKKRRRRRRRNKSKQNEEEDGVANSSHLSQTVSSDTTLHFEDVDEFPDLMPSKGASEDTWAVNERSTLSGTSLSYSDIIKSSFSKAGSQSRPQSLTGSCLSEEDVGANDEGNSSRTGASSESKRARKRRKRREQANKAAEAELAEISLEQQWLREMGLKKAVGQGLSSKPLPGVITDTVVVNEAKKAAASKGGGKKSQQPIAIDIAAMIDAIQKKPPPSQPNTAPNKHIPNQAKGGKKEKGSPGSSLPGNMLDSSAPIQKRGKERESGKAKKPSPLKKVILKEREQRKRLRLLDEDPDTANLDSVGAPGVGIVGGESELSQDALSSKSEVSDGGEESGAAELSADLSPISQTSPISMSPASPGNSGVNSPVTGSIGRDPVLMKIHSRRFREYCTQILDKEIDQCCASLLQDLVKFQDRMYHKDPVKAKSKRRVVLGLREVTKHLKLKKIKCVVISPNLEKIQSKGGLDEALNNILNMCQEQSVPFVFALGRCALGRACAKLVPVSVVGIFNYEGCEQKYNSLISLTATARAAYNEMVLAVEKEVSEYPASQTSSIGGVPGLFSAHMGHSRTPSGCSAISFTSSILSEPISENFPHAEPEVDSKGYEIVRDAAGNIVHPPNGHDIDDGNEADIEDFGEKVRKKKMGKNPNCVRFGDLLGSEAEKNEDKEGSDVTAGRLSRNVSESTLTADEVSLRGQFNKLEDLNDEGSENEEEKRRRDIEHIDSIHSENYNLGQEILSQHSSLPLEQRSKGQHASSPRPSPLSPSSLSAVCGSDIRQTRQDSGGVDEYIDEDEDNREEEDEGKSHHRIIDKERIKNWLESQTNLITGD